jgi:hypothetical protein
MKVHVCLLVALCLVTSACVTSERNLLPVDQTYAVILLERDGLNTWIESASRQNDGPKTGITANLVFNRVTEQCEAASDVIAFKIAADGYFVWRPMTGLPVFEDYYIAFHPITRHGEYALSRAYVAGYSPLAFTSAGAKSISIESPARSFAYNGETALYLGAFSLDTASVGLNLVPIAISEQDQQRIVSMLPGIDLKTPVLTDEPKGLPCRFLPVNQ